jgi:hypothetical protein
MFTRNERYFLTAVIIALLMYLGYSLSNMSYKAKPIEELRANEPTPLN